MKRDIYSNPITPLTWKQYDQLLDISRRIQPYLPFKEVAFIELLKTASLIIRTKGYNNQEDSVRAGLAKLKSKFYVHGVKSNNKNDLTVNQYPIVNVYFHPRMTMNCDPYNPIERDVFVMAFRACKKYALTGMTKESEDILIDRLSEIAKMMR